MPHLPELFSGTGSVGKVFREAGWRVTSVDCESKLNLTICCDVLGLEPGMVEGPVDLIWASPPCTDDGEDAPRLGRERQTGPQGPRLGGPFLFATT